MKKKNLYKTISFTFLSLILLASCSKAAPSSVNSGNSGSVVAVDNATDIKSRILHESEIELENGKKANARLVYNYDTKNKPDYSDIELQIIGREGMSVKIFDSFRRGRSNQYSYGTISQYNTGKDHLIKVDLSDSPSNSNTDSALYRISGDSIESLFIIGPNDFWGTGITVETDKDGKCTFKDSLHNITKPLDIKIDKPDAIISAEVRSTFIEVNAVSGECFLTVLESIVYKADVLYIYELYKYNGKYFESVKNTLTDRYYSLGVDKAHLYEYSTAYTPPVIDNTGNEFQVVDKLDKITLENMNDENNMDVSLIMPKGWYAKGYFNDIAPDFKFESEKNRHIKKGWSYELFNTNIRTDFYQYGIDSTSGYFDMPSYYRDHQENILMRNHAQIKEKVYSGKTILGNGDIYIVDCDLPKERRTKEHSTYEEVYAWIPIEGEQLAYNLQVDVPVGERTEDYITLVKEMLGVID